MSAYTPEDRKLICREMNFLCGCGTDTEWGIMLSLLERAEEQGPERKGFYAPIGNAPAEWVEFCAKLLDHLDFLEHGSSIGFAWLTEKGQLTLRFLREFGTEKAKWPAWAVAEGDDLDGKTAGEILGW